MKEISSYNKKKYKIIRIIIQALIILLLLSSVIYLTIKLYPYFIKIQNDIEYKEYIVDKIRGFGGYSILIIILLQIIQTIFMIIPAGPIVMISGMLLSEGTAVLTSIIGQTLGGIIVYFLVKQLGIRFIALFVDPKKIYESKLLKNKERCEVMMFGYLMIPALPKDIVSFIAPFTGIDFKSFVMINLFARIPMTIVSVFMGSSLIDFNMVLLIVLTIISCILALLCFIFHNKIEAFLSKEEKTLKLF